MAKPHKSKPNFLCCFGSFSHESSMRESDKFSSWRRVRKKSDSKTVPLDASLPDEGKQHRAHRVHSRKWRWNLFFKSRSNSPKPLMDSQPPTTNPKPPRQTPPVVPITPNHTPLQNPENENGLGRVASPQEDAREESISTPVVSHLVSLPALKRQQSGLSSAVPRERQTTLDRAVRSGNASRYKSYDTAFGLSVVLVTLVILIVWGRLCAILCTSAWFYLFPRIIRVSENDIIKKLNTASNDLDLDSVVYKKKVILEGLLERNHRVRHENSGN